MCCCCFLSFFLSCVPSTLFISLPSFPSIFPSFCSWPFCISLFHASLPSFLFFRSILVSLSLSLCFFVYFSFSFTQSIYLFSLRLSSSPSVYLTFFLLLFSLFLSFSALSIVLLSFNFYSSFFCFVYLSFCISFISSVRLSLSFCPLFSLSRFIFVFFCLPFSVSISFCLYLSYFMSFFLSSLSSATLHITKKIIHKWKKKNPQTITNYLTFRPYNRRHYNHLVKIVPLKLQIISHTLGSWSPSSFPFLKSGPNEVLSWRKIRVFGTPFCIH